MDTPQPDLDSLARQLFDVALDIKDLSERRKYLAQACSSYPTLLERVLSLLEVADELDDPVDPSTDLAGQGLGNYFVEAEIGRGGMGIVYRGHLIEDHQQQVAIKILNRGLLSPDGKRRFGKEMQIMARLNHPNLARLFTAGKTPNHLPYVVMEYIKGERIDDYCDNNKLTIRERLELFRKVCLVLTYAHANDVIHRDIKPGNILVTPEGEPKLIDFGIAKILKTGLETGTYEPTTHVQQRAFSIDYASPEQVRGDKLIGRTTDVYSLGVVLYQLLTGHRVHRFSKKHQSDEEIIRVVCKTEVTRPSLVVGAVFHDPRSGNGGPLLNAATIGDSRNCQPQELRRSLKGNLDSILLKALSKAPKDRYQSVEEFSDDIDNHLNGRRVTARKGIWRRNLKNFAHGVANNLPPTSISFRPKLAAYLLLITIAFGIWQRHTLWEILEATPQLNATSIGSSLRGSKHKRVQTLIDGLSEYIRVGLNQNRSNEPWEASQMIISTRELVPIDEVSAAKILHDKRDETCHCYKFPDREHIAASGWALLAILKLKTSPTSKQIAYFVDKQHQDGWWPLYAEVSDSSRNASTYATAYSVLSLYEYLRSGNRVYQDEEKVRLAIRKGHEWLIKSQIPGQARWWDVPNISEDEGSKKSIGISGLVLHVLHQTGADANELERLDKLWLQTLPSDLTDVRSTAALENGITENATNLALPWAIIATSDAYTTGTDDEKKAAITWMDRLVDKSLPEVTGPYFMKAELLIALRYLRNDKTM